LRTFPCSCGNTLYFDNTRCLQCGHELGFAPEQLKIISIAQGPDTHWHSVAEPGKQYRKCQNYQTADVCNWLVSPRDSDPFCIACRLNAVIPDLTIAENRQRWLKLERAKRRLIYTLLSLKLPIIDHKTDKEHGLAFRFMQDIEELDPFSEEVVTYEQIMTGHQTGTITINIIEADDSAREKIRENMNESYRTILGHFRHEIGHYYWDQLVARTDYISRFRELFGDERLDYKTALTNYYNSGPSRDWTHSFISAYASAHPWEDWAESWAHYLHFMDMLETASHHHVGVQGEAIKLTNEDFHAWLEQQDFNNIITQLEKLMRTLNELNRSLGFPDPYPFEHSQPVINKLRFIHQLVMKALD
jgi:hypothetical protein